jgi:uncharacterized protein
MVEKTTSTRAYDQQSPYVLDVRNLERQPGNTMLWRRRLPTPDGLGSDVIGVPAEALLDLDLRLESVSEGVLVSGTVSAPVQGECGRCLDPVDNTLNVYVSEMFAYPDTLTFDTTEEDEVHRVLDDLIDLEPVVRDYVVLALPRTPLCRPDCAGLCSECGQRLDDLPPDHAHEAIDPRWAALTNLSAKLGQTSQE